MAKLNESHGDATLIYSNYPWSVLPDLLDILQLLLCAGQLVRQVIPLALIPLPGSHVLYRRNMGLRLWQPCSLRGKCV